MGVVEILTLITLVLKESPYLFAALAALVKGVEEGNLTRSTNALGAGMTLALQIVDEIDALKAKGHFHDAQLGRDDEDEIRNRAAKDFLDNAALRGLAFSESQARTLLEQAHTLRSSGGQP